MTLLKIAWRNLWRNKRRSLITMASVFFAVILALLMRSMQLGTYDNMVKNAVSFYTGYIQIHEKGYWEDKTINNTFSLNKKLEDTIKAEPNVTIIAPRLESFALASSGNLTKGSAVIGTNPEKENDFTKLAKKLIKGDYLVTGDRDILVAEGLADYLKATIGDTLVLLGQGYHGITASGAYRIKGIIKFPTPEMNKQTVYMSLAESQYFFGAYNRITSLALMIKELDKMKQTVTDIKNSLGEEYEVMDWEEMMPDLVQEIEADNVGGLVMLGILYLIIFFGILGTIMMMTMERRKEFAVMIAVGMRKGKLILIILYETLIIGFLGVIAGSIIGLPIMIYMHSHPMHLVGEAAKALEQFNAEPIVPFALEAGIFLNQGYIVIIMAILAFLFPLIVISRFNVIEGMRQ